MKSLFYTLIAAFAILSCNSNTILKKPDNLIDKKKMVAILSDLYVAGAAYNVSNLEGERRIYYQPFIKEKYNIDSLNFENSIFYYMGTAQHRTDIYKLVMQKLETKLDVYKEEKKIQDSIANLEQESLEIEDQESDFDNH